MIDWFTTIAQIVNFLILVGLLRYFLYGRVMAAMQQREDELAKRWDEAERLREQAQQEQAAAETTRRQLDEQREELLAQIRTEVEELRRRMVAEVRREVDQQRQRWHGALREEQESFLRDLRRTVTEEVLRIARRALADLADASLEQQIVMHFVGRLRSLGPENLAALRNSLRQGEHAVTVETTFDVDDQQRTVLVQAIRPLLIVNGAPAESNTEPAGGAEDVAIEFRRSKDLLCGIAVRTNAHQVTWSLRHYLMELEQEIQRALEEEVAASLQAGETAPAGK